MKKPTHNFYFLISTCYPRAPLEYSVANLCNFLNLMKKLHHRTLVTLAVGKIDLKLWEKTKLRCRYIFGKSDPADISEMSYFLIG